MSVVVKLPPTSTCMSSGGIRGAFLSRYDEVDARQNA